MNKVCSTCKTEKTVSEFSKNKTTKDGYAYDCLKCHSTANKKWRKKNKDSVVASRYKSYVKRKENGQLQAKSRLHNAIDSGKIEKQNCVVCGEEGHAHHHFGYDKPLEVIWLCHKHHMNHHKYVNELISEAVLQERDRIVEGIKKINTKTHICGFNDGEQNCDCYKAGIFRVNRLIKSLKEK